MKNIEWVSPPKKKRGQNLLGMIHGGIYNEYKTMITGRKEYEYLIKLVWDKENN